MNERIRELEQQALSIVLNGNDPDRDVDKMYIPSEFTKKFAELFVAECMEQINKVEEKGDAHLGGGYFYDGTRLCRDAIKQHFGVEE